MNQRVLFLFWMIPAAFMSAESGGWELNPRIIELPGGLILDPEAPGAVEYRGITALRFLREDLAVAEVSGRQFSAFYQTVEGEARGLRIELRFKDDKILSLNLTKKADDRYLYLYRMPLDLFPSPLEDVEEESPEPSSPETKVPGETAAQEEPRSPGMGEMPPEEGGSPPLRYPRRGGDGYHHPGVRRDDENRTLVRDYTAAARLSGEELGN